MKPNETAATAAECLPGPSEEVRAPGQSHGWFRAMRSPEPIELIRANPYAFILAYIIAYRGQYSATFNRHNLALGEALLGDHRNYGMTQKEYRTAKQQLAKWGFAAFKGASTGTVATLTDTRLFSIFRLEKGEQNGEPGANEGRARGEQGATTKSSKKGKNSKNGRVPAAPVALKDGVPQ